MSIPPDLLNYVNLGLFSSVEIDLINEIQR
jgi:hypothetical protein